MKSNIFPKQASDKYWKENLSEESYRILREKGTEPPFSGKYNLHFENGYYLCKACENPLFKSGQKFDSGCGWPSFDDAIKGSVKNILDKSDFKVSLHQENIKGRNPDIDSAYYMIMNNPELLRSPIAIKGATARILDNPTDIYKM